MNQRILILGALSAVAETTARRYAERGATLILAGRDRMRLDQLAADLKVRGAARVEVVAGDLATSAMVSELEAMVAPVGGVDVVLLAYGVLSDEDLAGRDIDYAQQQLQTNFTSAALWCLASAALLKRQGSGVLIVLGSVAGDRGRGSNALYGAAKAGLGTLVQGLAHRLAGSGARAVLVKPGFIDTPMTDHLKKGGPLWASPDAVASVIVKAGDRSGPIVYAPGFWRLILLVIRVVPASLFHKTQL